ncbi:16692_t:CDS:1, partial [Cetraspora pellucida]
AANKYNYPVLEKIAQDFLAIQATSVLCEEAFSITSKTLSKLRNRLKSKTAHALLCFKNWIKIIL